MFTRPHLLRLSAAATRPALFSRVRCLRPASRVLVHAAVLCTHAAKRNKFVVVGLRGASVRKNMRLDSPVLKTLRRGTVSLINVTIANVAGFVVCTSIDDVGRLHSSRANAPGLMLREGSPRRGCCFSRGSTYIHTWPCCPCAARLLRVTRLILRCIPHHFVPFLKFCIFHSVQKKCRPSALPVPRSGA